jgi:phosphotransferase system HPr-like phosphotransfer protein
MKKFKVQLTTIEEVRKFVTAANVQYADIDICSGRYMVDAKSILGIFSLDLSKPVDVEVHGTEGDAESFYAAIKDVVVEA